MTNNNFYQPKQPKQPTLPKQPTVPDYANRYKLPNQGASKPKTNNYSAQTNALLNNPNYLDITKDYIRYANDHYGDGTNQGLVLPQQIDGDGTINLYPTKTVKNSQPKANNYSAQTNALLNNPNYLDITKDYIRYANDHYGDTAQNSQPKANNYSAKTNALLNNPNYLDITKDYIRYATDHYGDGTDTNYNNNRYTRAAEAYQLKNNAQAQQTPEQTPDWTNAMGIDTSSYLDGPIFDKYINEAASQDLLNTDLVSNWGQTYRDYGVGIGDVDINLLDKYERDMYEKDKAMYDQYSFYSSEQKKRLDLLEKQRDSTKQLAYIKQNQQMREIPQQLKLQGLGGNGASETTLLNMYRDYANRMGQIDNDFTSRKDDMQTNFDTYSHQAQNESDSILKQYNDEAERRDNYLNYTEAVDWLNNATVDNVGEFKDKYSEESMGLENWGNILSDFDSTKTNLKDKQSVTNYNTVTTDLLDASSFGSYNATMKKLETMYEKGEISDNEYFNAKNGVAREIANELLIEAINDLNNVFDGSNANKNGEIQYKDYYNARTKFYDKYYNDIYDNENFLKEFEKLFAGIKTYTADDEDKKLASQEQDRARKEKILAGKSKEEKNTIKHWASFRAQQPLHFEKYWEIQKQQQPQALIDMFEKYIGKK